MHMNLLRPRILLNAAPPGGGGGAAGPQWLSQLPDDIRSAPALASVPDIPTLAKNYLNAQSMIGADKILAPQKNWGEKEWGEFYDRVGRPKDVAAYKLPEDVKLHDSVKIPDERIAGIRQEFHKLGLTESQFQGVMRSYLNIVNNDVTAAETSRTAKFEAGMQELEKKWGKEHMKGKIDLANAAIKTLDTDGKFTEFLTESGLGNDPRMVAMMSTIGERLQEDTNLGKGERKFVKDAASAAAEIKRMVGDVEFQKALQGKDHPGHEEAVNAWAHAHKMAFGSQNQES